MAPPDAESMVTEQSIVSPDRRLLGAMCRFTCGEMDFLQVPKDARAKTAGNVVRAFLEDRQTELNGYEPVASHGGLVAFRRRPSLPPPPPVHGIAPPQCSELCVCNPVTGKHVSLPPAKIVDEAFVLIALGDGQFLLHVLNLELADAGMLQIRTYSSETGTWGNIVATYANLPLDSPRRFLRPTPLLLDGVAYFLCESDSESLGLHILAVPVNGQWRQPAPIGLPTDVLHAHAKRRFAADELMLASSTVNGTRRLTLAEVNMFTITLWTLENDGLVEPATWTWHSFIDLWKIKVQAGCGLLSKQKGDRVALECFSESSGAVLFHLYCHLLYKLDLQTGKVSLSTVYCKRESSNMCAYDIEDRAILSHTNPK
ncbi:unnamed protein product [Alopecurus aequalis]